MRVSRDKWPQLAGTHEPIEYLPHQNCDLLPGDPFRIVGMLDNQACQCYFEHHFTGITRFRIAKPRRQELPNGIEVHGGANAPMRGGELCVLAVP